MISVRGMGRLSRYRRHALSFIQQRAVILLYHRIAEATADPHALCVTPAHFAEHLEHLRRRYRVIHLRDLWQSLVHGEVPRDAVVVTFDDGYADNLYRARPVLNRADVPATCFVTSGYVGQGRTFWWDDLEQLLLESTALPESLAFTLQSQSHRWRLDAAHQPAPLAVGVRAGQDRLVCGSSTPREIAYREIWQLLQPLGSTERADIVAHLRAQAGASVDGLSDRRVMTADEVRRLGDGDLVAIGAHTVTHPMLASLPAAEQRAELHRSKAALEEMLGQPVTTLSYPFGGKAAVGAAAPRLAREMGFECACAVSPHPVSRGADRYRLPRFAVEDWDGDTFAQRLESFFGA